MTDIALNEMSPEARELVGQVIQANYNAYATASQQQIDNLERQVAELKAELGIIRERVEEVCGKPWAPSTHAVLAALFVTRKEIADRIAEPGDLS